MITEKHLGYSALSFLIYIFFLLLYPSCLEVDENFFKSKQPIIEKNEIDFKSKGEVKVLDINVNYDWSVEIEQGDDWISVSPMSGTKEENQLTITVLANKGKTRKGTIKVLSSSKEATLTINQEGVSPDDNETDFEYVTIEDIRQMYRESQQDEFIITEALYLKAVVISDRIGSNRSAKRDGYLQDEAGNGLAFRVKQLENLYNVGDQLRINLKDAKIHYFNYAGILQLVFSNRNSEVLLKDVVVTPRELTIEAVDNGTYDGVLVKIKDVQFKDYKENSYYSGEGSATYRTLEDVNGNTIGVRTDQKATFRDEMLPAGRGDIVGIVALRKEQWELQIRNLEDVKEMSNDESTRFEEEGPPVSGIFMTIKDLRNFFESNQTCTEEYYVEGEVILNAFKENVPENIVYIADETAGIVMSFSDKAEVINKLPMGAKVKVELKGVKAETINGLLLIGVANTLSTKNTEVLESVATLPLEPRLVTIKEVLAGNYQSELVRIEDVQFKEIDKRYVDNPFIINRNREVLQVVTSEFAYFSGQTVKQGMGPINVVVTFNHNPQLLMRSVADLAAMTKDRFDTLLPFLDVDTDKIYLDADGGQRDIIITANVSWEVKSDASWLAVTPQNGINDGRITVVADENLGKERTTTVIITSETMSKTIEIIQEGVGENPSDITDLFISEYLEGSSSNKYLEIYNGTGKSIDLSDYTIELYNNGNTSASRTQVLEGFLENGEVLVISHPKATLYDGEVFKSNVVNFNGDDAVALIKISTGAYIDIIGCIGEDPGKEWSDPNNKDVSTMDKTLVRKPSVRKGVSKNPAEGFPTLSSEWNVYPKDTASDLGKHIIN